MKDISHLLSFFPFQFSLEHLFPSLPFLPTSILLFSLHPSSIDHCLHSFLSNSFLCLFSLFSPSFPRFPFVQSYSISAFLPILFPELPYSGLSCFLYYFFSFLFLIYCLIQFLINIGLPKSRKSCLCRPKMFSCDLVGRQ